MPTLQRGLGALVGLLAINALALVTHGYVYYPWFDMPMHFMGGVIIGYIALAVWSLTIQRIVFQKTLSPRVHTVIYFVGILGLVALVGVVWEWYEFLSDCWAVYQGHVLDAVPAQVSLADTMLDLFLDLTGGAVAFLFWHKRSDRK